MKRTRPLYAGLLMWALLGFPVTVAVNGPAVAHAEEGMRAEVGTPLKAAQALLKAGKYKDALAKIRDADAVGGKNANESYMIERLRLNAAMGAGDTQQTVKSADIVLASGKVSTQEKLQIIEGLVGTYYRAKDYTSTATWANRYVKEGGTNPKITGLIPQLRFMSGDYSASAKEIAATIQADEKAGRRPPEEQLQLLVNCYVKLKDDNAYLSTMLKLVAYYPKKSYWTDVISRVRRKPGFPERLSLDLYRLKLLTDNMSGASDFMEMGQLALQEGFNAEAKKIVDQAYSNGAFGTGAEMDRQKRLRDLITKRLSDDPKVLGQAEKDAEASPDGTASINLGLNYITSGQSAKGLPLVDAGLKKGEFKRPDDAKLRAGVAFVMAGQKSKAVQALKSVQGADGSADLAKLWTLRAQQ